MRAAESVRPVVVCGIDDPLAERALVAFAAELVERIDGRLVLAHVQPPPLLALEPQIAYAAGAPAPRSSLRAAACTLARLAADVGIAPTTKVHLGFGDLEKRLLATARHEDAALIVIGSSLAPRLIGQASCPVIVLPASERSSACAAGVDWGHEPIAATRTGRDAVPMTSSEGGDVTSSIVCGVDGSREARIGIRLAAQLSTQLGVRLVVAHVVQPPLQAPGLGPTASQLTGIPIDSLLAGGHALVERVLVEEQLDEAERRVVLGFPADRLADLADAEAAELLVVGSRGRGAFKATFLGSVSTDLIGVARCPVLVVPPGVTSVEQVMRVPSATFSHAGARQ